MISPSLSLRPHAWSAAISCVFITAVTWFACSPCIGQVAPVDTTEASAPPADSNSTEADSTADDSTILSHLLERIQIRAYGAAYFHPTESVARPVRVDPYLRQPREDRQLRGGVANEATQDNPLYHGAGYLGVAATFYPIDGFRVWGELIGEYRGSSYGAHSANAMIVAPHLRFTFDTSVSVFGHRIGLGAATGHYVDLRHGEGLTIYNMDAIATHIWLRYGKFSWTYQKIGDGGNTIGLGIGDFNSYAIQATSLPLTENLLLDVRLTAWAHPGPVTNYPQFSPRSELLSDVSLEHSGYTVSGRATILDSLAVYAELGYRSAESTDYLMNRMALVAGLEYGFASGTFSVHATGEYRYYGGLFNVGFSNVGVRYRKQSPAWNGTLGDVWYPLYRIERSFSQWAVFTEYQDLKDVTGYTARLRTKYFPFDRFVIRGDLDFNFIRAEGTDGFLYPFYEIGIGWEPVDKVSVVYSITNKGMDLDRSYPTYYLYDLVARSITIRWNVW